MEVGVTESARKKLVRSTRAGHVERMGDEKLAKRKKLMSIKWKGNGDEENCDEGLH